MRPRARARAHTLMHFDAMLHVVALKNSFFCSPTGLVPEVPLLQAFENELGRGWTRLIIAIFTIICFCFSLLELSLPLHRMVSMHAKFFFSQI